MCGRPNFELFEFNKRVQSNRQYLQSLYGTVSEPCYFSSTFLPLPSGLQILQRLCADWSTRLYPGFGTSWCWVLYPRRAGAYVFARTTTTLFANWQHLFMILALRVCLSLGRFFTYQNNDWIYISAYVYITAIINDQSMQVKPAASCEVKGLSGYCTSKGGECNICFDHNWKSSSWDEFYLELNTHTQRLTHSKESESDSGDWQWHDGASMTAPDCACRMCIKRVWERGSGSFRAMRVRSRNKLQVCAVPWPLHLVVILRYAYECQAELGPNRLNNRPLLTPTRPHRYCNDCQLSPGRDCTPDAVVRTPELNVHDGWFSSSCCSQEGQVVGVWWQCRITGEQKTLSMDTISKIDIFITL